MVAHLNYTDTEILFPPNFKSNISAIWLVRELTSPRLDWPAASWFVGELSCMLITKLWRFYDRKLVIRFFENRAPGQFVDKPTRGQSSRGLVNSRTSQLAEMFDLKCGVYVIALSVISYRLHYLYAANIR